MTEILVLLMFLSCTDTYSIIWRDYATSAHEDIEVGFSGMDYDIPLPAGTPRLRVPRGSSYSRLSYAYPSIKARVDAYDTEGTGKVLEVFITDADLSADDREADLRNGVFHVKENPDAVAYTACYREGEHAWRTLSLDEAVTPAGPQPARHLQELYPALQASDYTYETAPPPINALVYGYVLKSRVTGGLVWLDDDYY